MRGAVWYSLSSVRLFYSRDAVIAFAAKPLSHDDLSQASLRFGQPAFAFT